MLDTASIAERLASERKRMNLSNAQVCAALEIHFNTYRNYETGKRDIPSSSLSKLWDMGFDVLYVLTGVRADDNIDEFPAPYDSSLEGSHIPRRVIQLQDIDGMNVDNPADKLLVMAYHVEETYIQTGARSGVDYTRKDLIQTAAMMLEKVDFVQQNKELKGK